MRRRRRPPATEATMLDSLTDRAHRLSSEVLTREQEVDHLEILSLIIGLYMTIRYGGMLQGEDLEELEGKIRALEEALRCA